MEPTRRQILALASAALVGCGRNGEPPKSAAGAPPTGAKADRSAARSTTPIPEGSVLRRRIPSTSEELPAIGLGSWSTFDVAPSDVASVQPVLARFLELGGKVVDTSPMYGRAEAAIGTMLADIGPESRPFLATKVWTSGEKKGVAQMRRSLELLGTERIDLMQIHNLVDWKTQIETLRAWKEAGTFRYIGITHYQHSAIDEMISIVERERVDFVQLRYSVAERVAERRLLPAAADAGVAVIVMSPFESGGLFERVRGRPLPPVAAELGASSWAQLSLLWILGHPAVTCPIPATSKLAHLEDNLGALRARVPDEAPRAAILAAIGA
jgi:aryl-alcohol dehydrogenase-like predicted oxidoreductase